MKILNFCKPTSLPKMSVSNTNRQLLLLYLFMVIIFFSINTPFASSLSFNFSSFSSNNNNITYERAFPQNQVIQLASRTAMIGRATYYKPMRLWQTSTRRLTDFSTHFSFVIDSDNRTGYGDGIAFFLAPQGSKIPNVTKGGSLGLTNDGEEINSTPINSFVAVEFDINTNPWDPPREHVGIDINSMRSSSNVTWLSNSSIRDGRMNEAWINYNSSTQNLSVVFTGFRDNATVMQYLEYKVDLRLYLPEFVTFGFSATTENASAVHTIHSWEFNSSLEVDNSFNIPLQPRRRRRRSNRKVRVAVGSSVGVGGFVVGLILLLLFGFGGNRDGDEEAAAEEEKEKDQDDNDMDDEFQNETGPRKFSYKELACATNDFSDENKLGQGGYGGVYKGFLRDTNSYIAVKKVSEGSKQGIKEYASEVRSISRLRHINLVQLLGWCHEKKEFLLVYEFVSNGSLDSYLFKEDSFLTWKMRYKIAQDLASGLLYLHEEWEHCFVHGDIKSSNIMLDSNFNAKIGDFGLAKLEPPKGSQTTVMAGQMGYMPPDCFKTGKASKETDVYSFGIVVLEIACGRKPINPKAKEGQVYLVQWVWELYRIEKLLEAADPRLCKEFDEQQIKRLMLVGLWCAHPDENLRPSMRQALQVLNFEANLPILPPNMPLPTHCTLTVNVNMLSGGTGQDQSSSYCYNTNSSRFSSSSPASASASLLNTS